MEDSDFVPICFKISGFLSNNRADEVRMENKYILRALIYSNGPRIFLAHGPPLFRPESESSISKYIPEPYSTQNNWFLTRKLLFVWRKTSSFWQFTRRNPISHFMLLYHTTHQNVQFFVLSLSWISFSELYIFEAPLG